MSPGRAAAALAAALTAVLVQATLVGPVTLPWPVSLPAVVVGAIGVAAGPAPGLVFGFGCGLLADLAGDHRVGLLALLWLLVGWTAGTVGPLATRRGARTLLVAGLAGAAALLATVADAGLDGRRPPLADLVGCLPAVVVDAGLAAIVLAVALRVAASLALRPAATT